MAESPKGKDGTHYVREQKGHSIIFHLIFGWFVLQIPAIYYTISKNHYWHAQACYTVHRYTRDSQLATANAPRFIIGGGHQWFIIV